MLFSRIQKIKCKMMKCIKLWCQRIRIHKKLIMIFVSDLPVYRCEMCQLEGVLNRLLGQSDCGCAGCFHITITSLNQQVVMKAFLPLPIIAAAGMLLSDLLQNGAPDRSPFSEVPRERIIQQVLNSSRDLNEKRMLFVLDAYSHGDSVELVVNRGFVIK